VSRRSVGRHEWKHTSTADRQELRHRVFGGMLGTCGSSAPAGAHQLVDSAATQQVRGAV